METKYRVIDDKDTLYGTYRKLEDAREAAQEVADDLDAWTYVEKITIENLEAFDPNN